MKWMPAEQMIMLNPVKKNRPGQGAPILISPKASIRVIRRPLARARLTIMPMINKIRASREL